MKTKIVDALMSLKVIQFKYDGEGRIVEPHCFGVTAKGNEAIRAFQIGGYSSSGIMGWRLYDLSKIKNLELLDRTFKIRDNYKKGDKGMTRIYKEL